MPKRSYPSSFSNGGFAKKARYTKKYGGTGKKYADKYKTGGRSNIEAILHEAEARAKKSALKVSETLYSQSSFSMDTKANLIQTGFNLSGLNQSASFTPTGSNVRANATNQCFVFPLSPMAQLGNQGTPGYRGGQKIMAHTLTINITHNQLIPTINGIYKYALLRNVSKTISGTGYSTPGITQTNALAMFVPLNQGALAASGPLTGALPSGDWSSITRWNRGDWRVCKSGSWTMPSRTESQNSLDPQDPTTSNGYGSNGNFTSTKIIRVNYNFKDQVWDYSDPSQTNAIKGGDYYFVMWREGAPDLYIGREVIQGTIELSFKDP